MSVVSRHSPSHVTPVQVIEEFCRAPQPGFRCCAAGDQSGKRFVARVRHLLVSPASPESATLLRQKLGGHADQAAAFFERHNGFLLYRDTKSDAAGIALLPILKWDAATLDMQARFGHLADEPESDPDHILTGTAIATVPHSGNYFVMPTDGPSAGKVFYADHDGWYESAFGEDFNGFLAHVVREPVKLLTEELGCYTRYSDGKTDAQWIPEQYFADVSQAQS
jgi:hypothetical protein